MISSQCACWPLLADVLQPLLQGYYEEQKREQMQGPALKRLEEEQQQQQAQSPPLVPLHPHQQQERQPNIAAGEGLDAFSEHQPSALQLGGARSWLGSSRQLLHQLGTDSPKASAQQQPVTDSVMGSGNGHSAQRPYLSAKPPLPSRPRAQISSEMSYLGGSAGSSTAGNDSD